jgi:hypothetical protein
MAPQTFHYFSTLPKADRELIWALAIRPERPSAHVFTLYNAREDTERLALSQYAAGPPPKRWDYALAAPEIFTSSDEEDYEEDEEDEEPDEDEEDEGAEEDEEEEGAEDYQEDENGYDDDSEQLFSWSRGNRSVYMIDAGLWTACRESRAVIERRFKVNEWEKELDQKHISTVEVIRDYPDTPATTWFLSDGEPQRCLVNPKTDLFFLLPFDPETTDWDSMWGLPFFSHMTRIKYGVNHVALDSDMISSDWDGPWTKCAIRAVSGDIGHWLTNFWFVDYSLQRKANVPSSKNRRQFYGHGCVFTEVCRHDKDWYRPPDWDEHKGTGVSGFLYKMECQVTNLLNKVEMPSPKYQPFDYRSQRNLPLVGVLAYEECDL